MDYPKAKDAKTDDDIYIGFNTVLAKTCTLLERGARNDTTRALISQFKDRIRILKTGKGPSAPVEMAHKTLYDNREYIITRNEEWLGGKSSADFDQTKISKDDRFILELFDAIKAQYFASRVTEKDILYGMLNEMLQFSCAYIISKPV